MQTSTSMRPSSSARTASERTERLKHDAGARLDLAVMALGFTAIITQTIVLREFLSVFSGNELIIGIVLANWMILTGVGAFLGKFSRRLQKPEAFLAACLIASALLPAAIVILLHALRNVVFPLGMLIGVGESMYSSFILLAPFCLLSGFLFSLLVRMIPERSRSSRISRVYALEAAGSVAGGLLLNFLLLPFLTAFQALLIVCMVNFGVSSILPTGRMDTLRRGVIIVLACMFILVVLLVDVDGFVKGLLFKGQDLTYHKETPYGDVAVTGQGDQRNFYENGVLMFSTNDPTSAEEAVHYAMIQRQHVGSVLLIAGGISGTIDEILKYGVNRIEYVELDPGILEAGKRFSASLERPQVHLVNEDARHFVRGHAGPYDVVLVNVPDPGTALINRYFTVEFLHDLKRCLSDSGVVSLSLLPATEYLGGEARLVSAVVYATLRSCFANVVIVPGNRNYFLASDGPLAVDIGTMVAARGIDNRYVNQYYLDDRMYEQRSAQIASSLDPAAPLNSDFSPIAYYAQVRYWLSYFHLSPWVIGSFALCGALAIGARLSPVNLSLFTGGLVSSSIEVILLVSFQALYGYVFRATGMIITTFMAGLAIGATLFRERGPQRRVRRFIAVQCAIVLYALMLPVAIRFVGSSSIGDAFTQALFLILTGVIAVLVGMEFRLAAGLRPGEAASVASSLYGLDLVGGALGALIASVFLIPLLGILDAGFVLAALALVSASIAIVRRNHIIASATAGVTYG